jgi:hypothetical protein
MVSLLSMTTTSDMRDLSAGSSCMQICTYWIISNPVWVLLSVASISEIVITLELSRAQLKFVRASMEITMVHSRGNI